MSIPVWVRGRSTFTAPDAGPLDSGSHYAPATLTHDEFDEEGVDPTPGTLPLNVSDGMINHDNEWVFSNCTTPLS